MKYIVTLAVLMLSIATGVAQVQTQRLSPQELKSVKRFNPKSLPAAVKMPVVDVNALLAEDELEKGLGLPFRFGKAIDVDLGLENAGEWKNVQGGRIWKLPITSENAYSINLIFKSFFLAKGAELYIYNQEQTMLMGPITPKDNKKSKRFSTDLIQGEGIVLELFEPSESNGESQLHLEKVIHGYKNTFKAGGTGFSGDCNIDINCPQGTDWQDESDAVAMVLLANGTRKCSGTLLNNTSQDFTPNFLTAFHCLNVEFPKNTILSQQEIDRAEDFVFRFQYKSPTCGGGDDTNFMSYSGSTFRSGWYNSDFALLELDQQPEVCTKMAGWNRGTLPATSATGIHHPSGDVMKISLDIKSPVKEASPNINVVPSDNFWSVRWNQGVTEGGSSGSGLFDQNHRLIGQLEGGDSSCATPFAKDLYGRFDISWTGGGTPQTRLSDWLDPGNTGALSINTKSPISINIAPPILCSVNPTGGVYTISNAPVGATVTWVVGADIDIVSGQGTNSLTVKASDAYVSGFREIWATVNASCGPVVLSKTIWIGEPAAPSGNVTGPTEVDASTTHLYQGSPADGATSYLWWLPYPFQVVPSLGGPANDWQMENTTIHSQLLAYTGIDGNSGYVQLMGVNDCGTGGAKILWVEHSGVLGGPGGPYDLRVSNSDGINIYPNPAENKTTVAIAPIETTAKQTENPTQITAIKILDAQMIEKISMRLNKPQSEVTVDVSRLKTGVYQVLIETDKGLFTKGLIIQ